MLILLFGPTGSGKSTIILRLCNEMQLTYVTPETTRSLRTGETDKVFVPDHVFDIRERSGYYEFVNYLFGCRYGTPRHLWTAATASVQPTHVLDFPIECYHKAINTPGHKLGIVIMPPSKDALVCRLQAAGRGDRATAAEIQYDTYCAALRQPGYSLIRDRVVINSDVDKAYNDVAGLIGGDAADRSAEGNV